MTSDSRANPILTLAGMGRAGVLVGLVIIVQSVVFNVVDFVEPGEAGVPPFVPRMIWFGRFGCPLLGPLVLAASLGVCFRKEWGRRLMAALLGLAALGSLVIGAMILHDAWHAPSSMFRSGDRLTFLIVGPIVVLIQAAMLGALTWFVAASRFEGN